MHLVLKVVLFPVAIVTYVVGTVSGGVAGFVAGICNTTPNYVDRAFCASRKWYYDRVDDGG